MTETVESLSQSLHDAVRLLQSAHRIAILSHVNPDADALGSTLSLAGGLRAQGKEVVVALDHPVPRYAGFLVGAADVVTELPAGPFDVFIFADAADISRVGALYLEDPTRFETAPILNIDHHRTNPRFGRVNYIDAHASSTSELAYHLLQALGAPIAAGTATALLFGIVGDTGSFQNGATTPSSLEVAAALVRCGAEHQRIAFHLFEWKTFAAARLWGYVLSGIELDPRRRIVFAYLSQEMLQKEEAVGDETEGVAEYLRGIEEADVVMLLKETEEGMIRVSMRSRPSVDVAAIATALGGGGHRQAAGLTIPGPFAAAQAALVETYDRLNPGA